MTPDQVIAVWSMTHIGYGKKFEKFYLERLRGGGRKVPPSPRHRYFIGTHTYFK